MPVRITASKNLALLRYRGETEIDQVARNIRGRFATADKYQIYDDKRQEAVRFLADVASGTEPDEADYPYLLAETGITAATMIDLASLWIFMDASWKQVAALIEKITIEAKGKVRIAGSQADIDAIVRDASAVLNVLGTAPPQPPKPPGAA